jgi:hypothetical protein
MFALRRFCQIPGPDPVATPAAPLSILLERYVLLLAEHRCNKTPLVHMYPVRTHPFPILLQRLDATLHAAFRRPLQHTLYRAAPTIETDVMQLTLLRQWLQIPTMGSQPIQVLSLFEPAAHPRDTRLAADYWHAINQRHSAPPPGFWTAPPPATLLQDATGVLQYRLQ